jgi:sugar phosphate permease
VADHLIPLLLLMLLIGAERAWALRFISLGGKLASFSTTLTPWLCVRVGWRGAMYFYGAATLGYTLIWELIAANSPAKINSVAEATEEATPAEAPKRESDWRIFTVPSVQACVLLHIATNNLWTVFNFTVFTFFDEVLGCTTVETGVWSTHF